MQPTRSTETADLLSQRFDRDGYIVLEGAVDVQLCERIRSLIQSHIDPLVAPVEFEAEVGYPGAPASLHTEGGRTPRRLLHAYARDDQFAELLANQHVYTALAALLGRQVCLSQCHHNCVMTKFPGYSSATLWHQDIRYWSFDRPELVTAWYALGEEHRQNGALRVIPGSHKANLDRGQLDADLFLRPELSENKALIHEALEVTLAPGDVLLFHCRLFHAAGKNHSQEVKLSPVFTFHNADNLPIPNTRSSQWPSIPVAATSELD